MRHLRRFALAAFLLDLTCGAAALVLHRTASAEPYTPVAFRFVATQEEGCVALSTGSDGVWRYEGKADAEACLGAAGGATLESVTVSFEP